MLITPLSLMAIGFGLGFMHALDADHVMAVSSLSNNKPGVLKTLKFCQNWALGHAGVLLFSGLLLFGLGLQVPPIIIYIAEVSVGVLLMILGVVFFWKFRRQRLRLIEHSHGEHVHRHWYVGCDDFHQTLKGKSTADNHAPVMVGVLHGFAGSAPALALVPAIAQGNILSALAYLLIFSLGVMLSMLFFGLGFSAIQQRIKNTHIKMFHWQRYFIASFSIVGGGFWVMQAV